MRTCPAAASRQTEGVPAIITIQDLLAFIEYEKAFREIERTEAQRQALRPPHWRVVGRTGHAGGPVPRPVVRDRIP